MGANVNAQTMEGFTPLMLTIDNLKNPDSPSSEFIKLISVILRNGGHPDMIDAVSSTAFDRANAKHYDLQKAIKDSKQGQGGQL